MWNFGQRVWLSGCTIRVWKHLSVSFLVQLTISMICSYRRQCLRHANSVMPIHMSSVLDVHWTGPLGSDSDTDYFKQRVVRYYTKQLFSLHAVAYWFRSLKLPLYSHNT